MKKGSFYKWANVFDGVVIGMFDEKRFVTPVQALNFLKTVPDDELKEKFNVNQNAVLVFFDGGIKQNGLGYVGVYVAYYYSSFGEVLLSKQISIVDYLNTLDKDEWDFSSKVDKQGYVSCKYDWLTAINEVEIPEALSNYSPDLLLIRHIDGDSENNSSDNLEWYLPELNPEIKNDAMLIKHG